MNTALAQSFGNRLKELRTEIGKSQRDLSKEIGLSNKTISDYEQGTRTPDIEIFKRIADYFGVSYEYLMGITDCRNKENLDIGLELGLDDKAIKQLKKMVSMLNNRHESYTKHINQLSIINFLLGNKCFNTFLDYKTSVYETLAFIQAYKRNKDHMESVIDERKQLADYLNVFASMLKDKCFEELNNYMKSLVKKTDFTSYATALETEYDIKPLGSILDGLEIIKDYTLKEYTQRKEEKKQKKGVKNNG